MIFITPFLLFFCSTQDDDCTSASGDCLYSEPEYGDLAITLTINEENPQIILNIYWGDYENEQLIISDTLSVENVIYTLPLGEYSGTVLYKEGDDLILAVDGDNISTDQEDTCEGDCWTLNDGELDLTL